MLMDQQQQQHPITPPPELVQQWCRNWTHAHGEFGVYLATKAARWGADQQLKADFEWLHRRCLISGAEELRAAMRPKPPSLAEEALKALQDQIDASFKLSPKAQERVDLICAALERLQELEKGNE